MENSNAQMTKPKQNPTTKFENSNGLKQFEIWLLKFGICFQFGA